jgi:hypothetical protein
MYESSTSNFGDKRTGCCIMTTHRFILPSSPWNFFTQNNITLVPNPPYFTLFPILKTEQKGRHFDTIEMMEAESQVLLKTLTEQLPGCI